MTPETKNKLKKNSEIADFILYAMAFVASLCLLLAPLMGWGVSIFCIAFIIFVLKVTGSNLNKNEHSNNE